jgi:hypothetical protein
VSVACGSFAITAASLETFSGPATIALQLFASIGNAAIGSVYDGSAFVAFSPFAPSAPALETFSGSVAATLQGFAVAANSTESFVGTGTTALAPFNSAALGFFGSFTGIGAVAVPSFAGSSVGFYGDYLGVGEVALSAFVVDGVGLVPIIFQSPDLRLERVATVPSRIARRVARITRR